jgi:membrane protease YdiL (CAAX protease family)
MKVSITDLKDVSPHLPQPFSLLLYLLLVFGLSWPFQIAYAIWGTTPLMSYLLSSLSMVMVAVATFIAGRFIFRDGFKNAGWSWGKLIHYLATFALAAFIFVVPILLESVLGMRSLPASIPAAVMLGSLVTHLLLTLIPGFGEEFGWRAYMLPHLARHYPIRTALLLHGLVWWAWHIPGIISIGVRSAGSDGNVVGSVMVTLLITVIPVIGNSIIYAYVWTVTQSLAVSSFYHAAYDEIRDTLEQSIGFGPLVSIWEMLVTTILGAFLLWKTKWGRLVALQYQEYPFPIPHDLVQE